MKRDYIETQKSQKSENISMWEEQKFENFLMDKVLVSWNCTNSNEIEWRIVWFQEKEEGHLRCKHMTSFVRLAYEKDKGGRREEHRSGLGSLKLEFAVLWSKKMSLSGRVFFLYCYNVFVGFYLRLFRGLWEKAAGSGIKEEKGCNGV